MDIFSVFIKSFFIFVFFCSVGFFLFFFFLYSFVHVFSSIVRVFSSFVHVFASIVHVNFVSFCFFLFIRVFYWGYRILRSQFFFFSFCFYFNFRFLYFWIGERFFWFFNILFLLPMCVYDSVKTFVFCFVSAIFLYSCNFTMSISPVFFHVFVAVYDTFNVYLSNILCQSELVLPNFFFFFRSR